MADFIHAREYLAAGDTAVVDCSHQCNVILMDDANFQNYRAGRQYNYYGGHFSRFPARISAPHAGYWNTVIDLGGGRANIRYNISYFKR